MSTLSISRFSFLQSGKGQGLVWLCRLAIASIFMFAAVPKLLDPTAFAESIRNYQMVSDMMASTLAVFLPVLEVAVAVGLILPQTRRGSAIVALGMLLMFCVVIGQAMVRGIDIDCGCFGSAAEASADWPALLRNSLLIVAAAFVIVDPYQPPSFSEGVDGEGAL